MEDIIQFDAFLFKQALPTHHTLLLILRTVCWYFDSPFAALRIYALPKDRKFLCLGDSTS